MKKRTISTEYLKVNKNWLFSPEHLVLTNRGLLKAEELKTGDKVIGISGKSTTIKNIKRCSKRPDAPIIGKI